MFKNGSKLLNFSLGINISKQNFRVTNFSTEPNFSYKNVRVLKQYNL